VCGVDDIAARCRVGETDIAVDCRGADMTIAVLTGMAVPIAGFAAV
jgi:hypothetical protein